MSKTVVGLYNSFQEARDVREALVTAGFERNDISVLAANSEDRYSDFVERNIDESEYHKYYNTEENRSHAAEGAVAGGLIGGAGGAILAVLIPGIGPFTATGWLLAGLVGLAGGAITGGILGALVDAGIDEEDAVVYSEGVRRGYALLTVRADDSEASRIANIMNQHDAIDTDQRRAYWESQGWDRRYDADEPVYNLQQIEAERNGYRSHASNSNGKSSYNMNGSKSDSYYEYGTSLRSNPKYTHSDWNMVETDIRRDWETRHSDDDSTWEDIKDSVRRGWESVKDAFDGDDEAYRSHYADTYATTGLGYDYYRPYYQYGYGLGARPAYSSTQDWNQIESTVRNDWERQYGDNDTVWEDVKDAVRSGWYSVKQKVS